MDAAIASPFDARADFGITNESSETMSIEAEPATDRGAPFQQFIANRFAPRNRAGWEIKSQPRTLNEAIDQIG